METRDFLILAYKAFNGEIRGKTKLQKIVYFLGVLLNKVDELGYQPHYYGPYSSDVANENLRLKSLGYLKESVAHSPFVNSDGFEISRYDFELTEEGKQIAERTISQYPEEWEKFNIVAKKIHAFGEIDYNELSIAAKAYFVLSSKGKANFKEIKSMTEKFGWSVTLEQLDKASKFLESIHVVEIKQ